MSLESQPISTVDSTTEFSVPVGIPPQAPLPSDVAASPRAVESIHAVEHVSMRLAGRYRPHPNKKTKLALSTLLIATAFATAAVTLSWMQLSKPTETDSLADLETQGSTAEDAELSELRHVKSQTPEKEKYRPHEELGIDLELRPVSDALVTAEDLIVGPVSDAPPVHVIPPKLGSPSVGQAVHTRSESAPSVEPATQPNTNTPSPEPRYALTEAAQPPANETNAVTTSVPQTAQKQDTESVLNATEGTAEPAPISDDLDLLIQSYRESYLSLKTDGGKQKRYGREYYASVAELCVWVNVANQVPREVENLVREIATDNDLHTLVKSAAYSWIRWPQRASDGVIVAGELASVDITDNATLLQVKTGHKGAKTITVKAVNGADIEIGRQIVVLGMISTDEDSSPSAPKISGYVIEN